MRASLVGNELTNAIGKGISYEVLSQQKIDEGFDSTLVLILEADDVAAQAQAVASAIEAAILQEDDSNVKRALASFAEALKSVFVG